jgi:hypothetical protein
VAHDPDAMVDTDECNAEDQLMLVSLPSCKVIDQTAETENQNKLKQKKFADARCAVDSEGQWDRSVNAFAEHINPVTQATTSAIAWGNTIVMRRVTPTETGNEVEMLQLPTVHGYGVHRMQFSIDGSMLFTVGVASRVIAQWQVWD